jgi:hypothetical protein
MWRGLGSLYLIAEFSYRANKRATLSTAFSTSLWESHVCTKRPRIPRILARSFKGVASTRTATFTVYSAIMAIREAGELGLCQ